MIENWKNRWLAPQELLFCLMLTVLVLFSFSLTAVRIYYTQQLYFLFLVWNLFLALLPWVLVTVAHYWQRNGGAAIGIIFLLGLSIAFLPNAPYLLTDLGHLKWYHSSNILWLDILMIVTYSITGLVGFYATVFVLEAMMKPYLGKQWTILALVLLFFLNGFGLYLGRFLRFNSWDIVTNPWILAEVIGERLQHPMQHPRTWGVTFGYGFLFLLGFWGLKLWQYALLNFSSKKIS